jgi:enterochelin esterase-like enzyme
MSFSNCTFRKTCFAIIGLLGSLLALAACTPNAILTTRPSPTAAQPSATAPTQTPTPAPTQASTTTIAPSATPFPTCSELSGRTESLAAVSTALGGALQARVHLPPCYDPSGKTRYPVLYLLHGQGFTSDQWERLGIFKAADSHALASGQALIIVLPNEENTTLNPFESAFGTALTTSLMPQVDANYATCAQRACRAIGGLSRGASWAVYLGLKNWGQFGVIGAHSFPPFFGLDHELPGLLRSIVPGQLPRLYLDIGLSDPYRVPAAAFEAQLTQSGIPHEWYLNAGGHDETYWSQHAPAYMEWYSSQFAASKSP